MDQKKGAGHHAITKESARQLFQSRAVDGQVDGMDFEQFYAALDEGQEHADRTPLDSPLDPGDTWKPYWADPDAQRRHSMADPALGGEENLEAVKGFVAGQLDDAKSAHDALQNFDTLDTNRDSFLSQEELEQGGQQGVLQGRAASYLKANTGDLEELSNDEWGDENDGVTKADLQKAEMRNLGAATHALEDSYSNAHMFRDASDPANPHAPVEAFNVFNPTDDETLGAAAGGALAGAAVGSIIPGLGTAAGAIVGGIVGGIAGMVAGDDMGTHDKRFDEVPVDAAGNLTRSSDQAAAAASAEMLGDYYAHRDEGEASAHSSFDNTVGSFYQPSSEGVKVYQDNDDPNWQAERDERLESQE
jgi:hypothetical protein